MDALAWATVAAAGLAIAGGLVFVLVAATSRTPLDLGVDDDHPDDVAAPARRGRRTA